MFSPQKAAPARAFHLRCFLSQPQIPRPGGASRRAAGVWEPRGRSGVSPCPPPPAAPAAAPGVWRRLGPALPNGSREVTVLIKVRWLGAASGFLALLLLPEQPEVPPSLRRGDGRKMPAQLGAKSLHPCKMCPPAEGTAVLTACLGVRPHKSLSVSPLPAAASPGCPREDPGLCRVRRGCRGNGDALPHLRHRVRCPGAAGSPRPPRHRSQLQRGFQPRQHPPKPGRGSGR